MSKLINKPNTLEECFLELDKFENINEFIELEESELALAHFGLGRWIRNNWNLWTANNLTIYFNSMSIFHADDMSSIIITSYHRLKNNKPIKLEEQVETYIEYWLSDKKRLLRQRKKKLLKIK